MKPIENKFTKGGFDFNLVKREKSIAFFEKVMISKPDQKWFEVVKLENDTEFDSEVYPAPSTWNISGFTFSADEIDKAEETYTNLVNQCNNSENNTGVASVDQVEATNTPVMDSNPPAKVINKKRTKANKAPKVLKTRGRKKYKIDIKIPHAGTFTAKQLALETKTSVPFMHNRLQGLIEEGVIEIDGRVQGKHGRPVIQYIKKVI